MLTAPTTPSMRFTSVASVVNAFVKLRQVEGDVACLASEHKSFEYRGILKVKAIHLSQTTEDEQQQVIEAFKSFLETISFPIQLLIRNRSYDPEHYLQMLAANKGLQTPMTHDHMQFVRALASRRALVTREFYVIVPADHQAAKHTTEALLHAQVQLKQRIEVLSHQLERVGLTTQRLTTAEIVQLYQSCYTPWEEHSTERTREKSSGRLTSSTKELPLFQIDPFSTTYQELEEHTRLNQQMAKKEKREVREQARKKKMPNFVKVPGLIIPSTIQVFPSYLRIERDEQREYVRTLALASYPLNVYPGWFDSIIQVNESNIDFCIHVNPLSQESASTRLRQKALQFRGATLVSMRQGRTADPAITRALGDVERLHENITSGDEQAFTISVFIQVRGRDRQDLDERSERIVSAIHNL